MKNFISYHLAKIAALGFFLFIVGMLIYGQYYIENFINNQVNKTKEKKNGK